MGKIREKEILETILSFKSITGEQRLGIKVYTYKELKEGKNLYTYKEACEQIFAIVAKELSRS
jgi:hypothetical protein